MQKEENKQIYGTHVTVKGVIASFLVLRWSLVAMNTLCVGFGEKNALVLLFHSVLVWWRR